METRRHSFTPPKRSDPPARSAVQQRTGGQRSNAGSAALPRYRRLAEELMQRIDNGEYAVGDYLPTERELCLEYRVSRHTVREALRRLRDAGLISRRRRLGTEVVSHTPPAYRQPANSIKDFLQYADETQLSILQTKTVTCDAALAKTLQCELGDRWLRVSSLRAFPDDPRAICLTTAYITGKLEDIKKHVEKLSGPISAMLESVYGLRIARIDQSIQAVRIGKREARLLHAEAGSPALRATRRYYDSQGHLIEFSSAIHPSDRFVYVTSLESVS